MGIRDFIKFIGKKKLPLLRNLVSLSDEPQVSQDQPLYFYGHAKEHATSSQLGRMLGSLRTMVASSSYY